MPVEGYKRYFKLLRNIGNPGTYLGSKFRRTKSSLTFITRPRPIRLEVPPPLFLVFKEIFMSDVYDIDELVSKLPAKPVVIDIGANAGYFDFILLSKVKDARIFAYEPVPANVKLLQSTIENNGLMKEITLHPMAVTGTVQDHLDLFVQSAGESTVVASALQGFHNDNTQKISVPATTLQKIIEDNRLERIDVLKMDCEGSEFDIMYNTPSELLRRASILAIEVHDMDKEKKNIQYFDSFLNGLGYTTEHTQINGFCHAVTAIKRAGE